jgi:hypothetical protein
MDPMAMAELQKMFASSAAYGGPSAAGGEIGGASQMSAAGSPAASGGMFDSIKGMFGGTPEAAPGAGPAAGSQRAAQEAGMPAGSGYTNTPASSPFQFKMPTGKQFGEIAGAGIKSGLAANADAKKQAGNAPQVAGQQNGQAAMGQAGMSALSQQYSMPGSAPQGQQVAQNPFQEINQRRPGGYWA